jgi:hypothetical protein
MKKIVNDSLNKEEFQNDSKPNTASTSLVVIDIQIKIIVKYHLKST